MRLRGWLTAGQGDTRLRTAVGFAAGVAGLLLLTAPASAAVAPAPAWNLSPIAAPTTFSASNEFDLGVEAGQGQFQIRLINVGGASTDGSPIEVTDTLPVGLTTASIPRETDNIFPAYWSCMPAGAGNSVIACTHEGKVGSLAQPPPISVPVDLAAGLSPDTVLTNKVEVSGGGAPPASATDSVTVESSTPTPFGIAGLSDYPADLAGAPDTQAADHPASFTTTIDLNSAFTPESPARPAQFAKDIVLDLPLGFVGDPQALPRCPLNLLGAGNGPEFEESETRENGCPADTRVGTITLDLHGGYNSNGRHLQQRLPISNLAPAPGNAAEFGFIYLGQRVVMHASLNGDYGVRVAIPGISGGGEITGVEATFFGNPTVHDGGVPPGNAFFINPTDCSRQPLRTVIHTDTWSDPAPVPLNPDGSSNFNAVNFSDPRWKTVTSESPPIEGCENPQLSYNFNPTISVQPDNAQAASPAGYIVDLHIPQTNISNPEVLATPDLRKAVVTLPQGVVVNPSSANGLAGCSSAQIDLANGSEPPDCPDASKIGAVEVDTPILEHPLPGSVYLAAQDDNPFHSLLAIYIVVDDPATGVIVKLAGHVEPDAQTGQLRTTFNEDPQLPFEDFKLDFFGGPHAPLQNPDTCGKFTTTSELTPWSGGTPVSPASNLEITSGPNGGPCPSSFPFAPSFSGGTTNNQAGAFSPFTTRFSRQDGEQDLSGVSVTTPPGLLGMLSSVPLCGEPQAAQGECSSASQIGHVTVGAGAGSSPVYLPVPGEPLNPVYLTGPYHGAPFGLSVVVPAIAGPFNLGTVVVRAAISVDPHTAQVTVTSDPLPQILDGIPLQVKSVNVTIDRQGFMFNPTNCGQLAINGTVASAEGASTPVSSRFQAANCANLPFKPRFSASTAGKASKANGASLDVKVTYPNGPEGTYANIKSVKVDLPKQLPSRLTTLQKACLAATFETNPASCPTPSNVGMATATTPVLANPLGGPAYLVSHGGEAFPDLEIVLQGEGITLILDGNTQIKKGITSSTFKTIPDAPVSSFELNLTTGKYSILGANVPQSEKYSLCGQTLAMPTAITGQNSAVVKQSTKIAVTGCAKALTQAQKLAAALRACRTKSKGKRAGCEKRARKKYAPAKAEVNKKHNKQH